MNYRHGFHAGNFADCAKHALLVELARAMQRKPGGIAMLDTHAGTGSTRLDGDEAGRTGEWRDGILRVAGAPAAEALAPWLGSVRALGFDRPDAPRYPGSPALLAAMLRPQDRLDACELHPVEHRALRAAVAHAPGVHVHHRDGYGAIAPLLPPASGQRRALVLVDPPYEGRDEFAATEAAIGNARARLPDAVVACWYPVKHRAPVRASHDRLRAAGTRDLVAFELLLRPPLDPTRLNGSGLLVASPPWGFEARAAEVLGALSAALSDPPFDRDGGGGVRIERLADG